MKVLRAMLPFSFILHLILIIDEALFYIYTVPIVMTSKWWKWDLQKALLFHRPENVCLTKVLLQGNGSQTHLRVGSETKNRD